MLSILLVFTWTAARVHYGWNGQWTAVFNTGARFRVPPDLAAGTYRVPGLGYDGQFYRYLAHDPFLRKDYARYVDAPQLRFRRVLLPFAAWLLAFGNDAWIDGAFIALELIFLGLGVYWTAALLARRGRSPLWGLLFVLVPATLASFDRMLLDGPLAALFAGFLLYYEEERWTPLWIVVALAALTRENGLALIAALVVDRWWHSDWRKAAWFAAAAAPSLAWYGFLALRLPPDAPPSQFEIPAWGIVRRLFWLRPYPDPRLQWLLRITDVLAVLGLAASLILAVYWLRQRRFDALTVCIGLFVLLGLVMGSRAHMTDAFGFSRPVSPLFLWIMLEAVTRRSWSALAPPLLVSLSVSLTFARPLLAVMQGLWGR